MTIASDLTASLITLDRLHEVLLEDGHNHRATILGLVIDNLRDCAERARLVEQGVVPRHWLAQLGDAAAGTPGVVSLAARKAARVGVALAALLCLAPAAQAEMSLFAGARAGMMLFDSTAHTPVGKIVDMGGDAPAYAVFAGADYRAASGWFIGGEVLAGTSAGRSRLVMRGVDYTLSIPLYTEAAVRAGWRMHSGAAFYLRGGVMAADVQEGGRSGWRTSPLVGLGAEVPFRGGWFARIDASWADLGGLEVWQAGGGVGWRW